MPGSDDNNSNKMVAIEVALARLEGTLSTEIKNLVTDVKNLSATLALYATARDLAAVAERAKDDKERVTERLRTLEAAHTWVIRSLLAGGASSAAGFLAVYLTRGHP